MGRRSCWFETVAVPLRYALADMFAGARNDSVTEDMGPLFCNMRNGALYNPKYRSFLRIGVFVARHRRHLNLLRKCRLLSWYVIVLACQVRNISGREACCLPGRACKCDCGFLAAGREVWIAWRWFCYCNFSQYLTDS